MKNQSHTATFKTYTTGFILSIILTLAAYFFVVAHIFNGAGLITVLVIFALIQLVVQLLFFLHLGQEANPRWNLIMFVATIGIVLTVVVGSLWIMAHLNYRMMGPQMDKQIMQNEGMQK